MMGNCLACCFRRRLPHYAQIGEENWEERSRLLRDDQQRPLSTDYSPPATKQYGKLQTQ